MQSLLIRSCSIPLVILAALLWTFSTSTLNCTQHCPSTGTPRLPTAALWHLHLVLGTLPDHVQGLVCFFGCHCTWSRWSQTTANRDSKIPPSSCSSRFLSSASWRHGLIFPWWITLHLSTLKLVCPLFDTQSFLWGLSAVPHHPCGVWLPKGAWLHLQTQFSVYTWPAIFYSLSHSRNLSKLSISQMPTISCYTLFNFPTECAGDLGTIFFFSNCSTHFILASNILLLTASRLQAGFLLFWTAHFKVSLILTFSLSWNQTSTYRIYVSCFFPLQC